MKKGIGHEILTRVLGFIVFLVLIGILNLLTYYVQNNILSAIVHFLNANLILIIVFTIIFIIADIFYYLWFPLSLPAPLLAAFGSLLLVWFIYNLVIFVLSLFGITLIFPLNLVFWIIGIVVFVIVIIVGYVRIIAHASKRHKHRAQENQSERHAGKKHSRRDDED